MAHFASFELSNRKAVTIDMAKVVAWADASTSSGPRTIIYLSSGAELAVQADMADVAKLVHTANSG